MRLFDTLSREVRELHPIDGKTFRFYCCGPTVYGPAHIGNFRTFVLQDVFRRVLEIGGLATRHVRNVTDVDDKTIRGANEAGQPLEQFTGHWLELFERDAAALGLLPPHVQPGAVAHIPQQIDMIQRLLDRGHAYQSGDGSVYFRVASFEDYGRLSHLDQRELKHGASTTAGSGADRPAADPAAAAAATANDADEYDKDSVADFALWKRHKPEDGGIAWDSPWGRGRPGWHLECSAMIEHYLGTDFDLHSGGVDLVFPHHENEIAQSCCAAGGSFARHWFHINHLMVDGGKMSKSLGNLHTIDDLGARGHDPMAVRYVLLSGTYRRPLNFTLDSLHDAGSALARLGKFAAALQRRADQPAPGYEELRGLGGELADSRFGPSWQALNEDLNTPAALGRLFTAVRKVKPDQLQPAEAARLWRAFQALVHGALGLTLPVPAADGAPADSATNADAPDDVKSLADRRWQAKQDRDFGLADNLRAELLAAGWQVMDRKDGYDLNPAP